MTTRTCWLDELTGYEASTIVGEMSFAYGSIRRLIRASHSSTRIALVYSRQGEIVSWLSCTPGAPPLAERLVLMGWTRRKERYRGHAREAFAALAVDIRASGMCLLWTASRALSKVARSIGYECELDGTTRSC